MVESTVTQRSRVARLIDRLDTVRDGQLFLFTVVWVIAGGLLLQLVILPHIVPSAHWGHGLIRDLDSIGYHVYAARQAELIQRLGWSAWELRPEGQSPAGLASIFYALIHPEPWSVLPLNGVLFATAVTAVRRFLATIVRSDGAALLATIPFFVYPSFVPIWGQLQKDVTNGAGLALMLAALVLAAHPGPRRGGLTALAGMVSLGLFLIWVSRPYMMTIATIAALAGCGLVLLDPRCCRLRLLGVMAAMLVVTYFGVQRWQDRPLPKEATSAEAWRTDTGEPEEEAELGAPLEPGVRRRSRPRRDAPSSTRSRPVSPEEPGPPGLAPARYGPGAEGLDDHSLAATLATWLHLPRVRMIDPTMPTYGPCAPEPTRFIERALFSLCLVREGFIGDAARHHAGSGFDYRVRLRSIGDVIAYLPRAVLFSTVQPAPGRWGKERTPVGRLASVFIPFEMVVAYIAFALLLVLGWRCLRRTELWLVAAACVVYGVTFAYTMPQIGTLYRMRAFAFAILVSMALAGAFAARLRPSEDNA